MFYLKIFFGAKAQLNVCFAVERDQYKTRRLPISGHGNNMVRTKNVFATVLPNNMRCSFDMRMILLDIENLYFCKKKGIQLSRKGAKMEFKLVRAAASLCARNDRITSGFAAKGGSPNIRTHRLQRFIGSKSPDSEKYCITVP